MLKRIWVGHRTAALVAGAIAALAIGASALLVVAGPLNSAPAASPSASQMAAASASASEVTATPSGADEATPSALPPDWSYSDLDGVAAPNDLAHRLPLAIMIDDQAVARPQSGISSASIVYQAPADGGEDRYMMVFQEGTAADIGPVRSARPYFVYWAAEYKALYGHYGGDAKVLSEVIPAMASHIYNMDALRGGACPYRRVTTRPAPHNAYTTTTDLLTCAGIMKYPSTYQNLPVRTFRDDTPLPQRPASQVITIDYHTGTVGYDYDPGTNRYLRIMNGKPEIDPANGSQVYARNIVVMYQLVTIDPNSEPGHNRPDVHSVGSGKATLFLEGRAIDATWKKTSNTALTRFYDSAGLEIPLLRGEIFIQSVPPTYSITVG